MDVTDHKYTSPRPRERIFFSPSPTFSRRNRERESPFLYFQSIRFRLNLLNLYIDRVDQLKQPRDSFAVSFIFDEQKFMLDFYSIKKVLNRMKDRISLSFIIIATISEIF